MGRVRAPSSDLAEATDAVAEAGLDPGRILAAGLEAMRAMMSANRADGVWTSSPASADCLDDTVTSRLGTGIFGPRTPDAGCPRRMPEVFQGVALVVVGSADRGTGTDAAPRMVEVRD